MTTKKYEFGFEFSSSDSKEEKDDEISIQKKTNFIYTHGLDNRFVEYKKWLLNNPPQPYNSNCCRSKKDITKKCGSAHKMDNKQECEAFNGGTQCIWGILNQQTITRKLSINIKARNWIHNIGHFDKYQFSKHEWAFTDGLNEISEDVYEPNQKYNTHNHFFGYDRCGNYVKLSVATNSKQLKKLKEVKYLQTAVPTNVRYIKPNKFNWGILKIFSHLTKNGKPLGQHIGSGTLISPNRIVTCSHNFALKIGTPEGRDSLWTHRQSEEHKIQEPINDPLKWFGLADLRHAKYLIPKNRKDVNINDYFGDYKEMRAKKIDDFDEYLVDFVIFDAGGVVSFAHDFAVVGLRKKVKQKGLFIWPFGIERYNVKRFGSIGARYHDTRQLSIDTKDSHTFIKNYFIEKGLSTRAASKYCRIGTMKAEGRYLHKLGMGDDATSGQSGSLCYDFSWKKNGLQRPFINGIYVGSHVSNLEYTKEEIAGFVSRFNLVRFLMMCDSLNPSDREQQCDPIFFAEDSIYEKAAKVPKCIGNRVLYQGSQLKCQMGKSDVCLVKHGTKSMGEVVMEPVEANINFQIRLKARKICKYMPKGLGTKKWKPNTVHKWEQSTFKSVIENNNLLSGDSYFVYSYNGYNEGIGGSDGFEDGNDLFSMQSVLVSDALLFVVLMVCCMTIGAVFGFIYAMLFGTKDNERDNNETDAVV
eukprot:542920_1